MVGNWNFELGEWLSTLRNPEEVGQIRQTKCVDSSQFEFKHANVMASVPGGIRHPTVKLLCENGVKLGLTLIPTWSRTFPLSGRGRPGALALQRPQPTNQDPATRVAFTKLPSHCLVARAGRKRLPACHRSPKTNDALLTCGIPHSGQE